jgi:hypothetical protein
MSDARDLTTFPWGISVILETKESDIAMNNWNCSNFKRNIEKCEEKFFLNIISVYIAFSGNKDHLINTK